MTLRCLALTAILLCVAVLTPSAAFAQTPPAGTPFFLLMGQSNMVGYYCPGFCTTAGIPVPPNPSPTTDLYSFTNAYTWQQAPVEPMDSAAGQVDTVSSDPNANYGPSQEFGTHLIALQGGKVALVPCALGSTAISQWQPTANHDDRSTLYGSCHHRKLVVDGYGDSLGGVLWFQGEGDTTDATAASNYAAHMTALFNSLRQDFGPGPVPICYAQLSVSQWNGGPYFSTVQAQQASACGYSPTLPSTVNVCVSASNPNTGIISTNDLSSTDGYHFTQAGYRTIGDRFAQCIAAVKAAIPTVTPTVTRTPTQTPTPTRPLVGVTCNPFSCGACPTP